MTHSTNPQAPMTTEPTIVERLRLHWLAWSSDADLAHVAEDCDSAADEIDRLTREVEALRAALLLCARKAESLKRDCPMDPESPQAIRNSEYQYISTMAHIALGTIKGPPLPPAPQSESG